VRLPAHLTASGRAVLACLPPGQVRALFPDASVFVRRGEAGPRSLPELRSLLAEARRRGHATEEGEVTPAFSSIAAAVPDHRGHPVAGVAVTFPTEEVDAGQRQDIAAQVIRTAQEVSRRVGGVASEG
jgi:DNA-binding IclR family transcriptional regulator